MAGKDEDIPCENVSLVGNPTTFSSDCNELSMADSHSKISDEPFKKRFALKSSTEEHDSVNDEPNVSESKDDEEPSSEMAPPLTVEKVGPSKKLRSRVKRKPVKRYPPVSVRKVTRCVDDSASKGKALHSAQCMKSEQKNCDFVCDLYKLNDWRKVAAQELLGSTRGKNKRKTPSDSKSAARRKCCLCEKKCRQSSMTCLELDVPLPSSFLKPTALLRQYGITLKLPSLESKNEEKDASLFFICKTCNEIILNSDFIYEKLKIVTKQMKTSWSKQLRSQSGEDDVEICVKFNSEIFPVVKIPEVDKKKKERVRSKGLTCGLCGSKFFVEAEWHSHLEDDHRVKEKWRNFTPAMHSKFRSLLIKEVIRCGNISKGHSSTKTEEQLTHVCYACDDAFNEPDHFIAHLASYHNMSIDMELLSLDQESDSEFHPVAEDDNDSDTLQNYRNNLSSEYNANCQNVNNVSQGKLGVNENSDQISNVQAVENVCLLCDKKFDTKKEFGLHIGTYHLSSPVVKGNDGGDVSDCGLDIHSIQNEGNKATDAESDVGEGGSASKTSKPLTSGTKKRVRKSRLLTFECDICHQKIKGKKYLNEHLKKVHNAKGKASDSRIYLYCKCCLFRCKSRQLLDDHMKEKHGIEANQQQCETCGKFYSTNYIQEHVAVMHSEERKHSCEYCGMKFFDKKGVKTHIYFDHPNKEWKCEKCDVTFNRYHQLRQHMIYVHSNKVYNCERCDKSFKRKGDLTEHVKRTHDKVTLVCHLCPKTYRHPQKFKIHLMNVHGLTREETFSKRYARHKRANNRAPVVPEKVKDKVKPPQGTRMQNEPAKGEPQFQMPQSANQAVNQAVSTVNQVVNQSVNQGVQGVNQAINQGVNQAINQGGPPTGPRDKSGPRGDCFWPPSTDLTMQYNNYVTSMAAAPGFFYRGGSGGSYY